MENRQNNNVSVVMSVHNGEKFIKQAVESILCQNFIDFEFLIVNDGSTDGTSALLVAFALKDRRVKIIHNSENLGLTASLNKGLNLSKGKYIARMDDDDISSPSRLQKQFDFMEKNQNVALCGSLGFVIDEKGETIGQKKLALSYEEIKERLLFNNQFIHSSLFIRKSVLGKEGFYNLSFKKSQDYELVLRLAAKYPVFNLDEELIQWRKRADSLSFANKEQQKYALKARWWAITRYHYPKLRGLFHIALRTVWLLLPLKLKEKLNPS